MPSPCFFSCSKRGYVPHLPWDSISHPSPHKNPLAASFLGSCPASAVSLRKLKLLKVSEREEKNQKIWHLFLLKFLVSLMKHGSLLLQRSSCFADRRECAGCLGSLPAASSQQTLRNPVQGRPGVQTEGGAGARLPLPPAPSSSWVPFVLQTVPG